MPDLLSAASAALGVPEALVKRSAEARAQASGGSADEILQAWAGGETVTVAAPGPEPEPAPPEPDQTAAEPATPEEAPAAAPPVAAPAEPVIPVAAATEEPIQPAPLRDRIRLAGRAGALVGGLAGLLIAVFSAPWLLPRASLAGEEGAYRAAFEVTPGAFILGYAAVSLAIGAALAALTRSVTGWFGRGKRLVGSPMGSVLVGAVIGTLLGFLLGAVIAGSGAASTVTEGIVVVPVLGSIVWSALGWLAGGWVVGAAVQALGVPAGITDEEVEEVGVVKRRLGSAYGIPALAALAIALLVLPVGYMFIQFPEWAPLLGIFIAIGILAFAGLSASRPNARLSAGDLLAAIAGIGVVVVIVVAVLVAQGHGRSGEEGEAPEPAPAEAAQAAVA